jgi:hypothetical protein
MLLLTYGWIMTSATGKTATGDSFSLRRSDFALRTLDFGLSLCYLHPQLIYLFRLEAA